MVAGKKKARRTPQLAIKAWMLAEKGDTRPIIAEKMGIGLSTAHRWVTHVTNTPKLLAKARQALDGHSGDTLDEQFAKTIRTPVKLTGSKKMQEEIDYLRWSLEGERKGYVDRMLKELGK